MKDDYLWDKSGEPDPEIARLEGALGSLRHEGEWAPPKRRPRRAWIAAGALALAAGVALAIGLFRPGSGGRTPIAAGSGSAPIAGPSSAPSMLPSATLAAANEVCSPAAEGFAFEATGDVACGGGSRRAGNLPVDTWIETPAAVSARLRVATIGSLFLYDSSKLRIVRTGEKEHRLELVRGRLHARVEAPPRLFVIDTRAATAVDLGCEYDLLVDEAGSTALHVTWGAVSLEGKGRAAYVPEGAHVRAHPDRGPGIVLVEHAEAGLDAAARRADAGDPKALDDVIAESGARDAVTLWNLFAVVSEAQRAALVGRIDALGLRPRTIAKEALLRGENRAIDALRTHLETQWFPEPAPPPTASPKNP